MHLKVLKVIHSNDIEKEAVHIRMQACDKVVIFDRDGKEIASKKLFEDGQKGSAGKMVRMSGREVLFLDSWAPSLLSITW